MTNTIESMMFNTIDFAREKLDHTFAVTEVLSDAFQNATGFNRTGACDENLDYTAGFLSYTQLALGAEYSFDVGTSHFTVKDFGEGRGICVRCERR